MKRNWNARLRSSAAMLIHSGVSELSLNLTPN
jgi:hypothetical protein